MFLGYRLSTVFLIVFFLEPQWQVKLFYAFQHIQKTNVEWNIFMAIEHDPNDTI